ncbi:signal peptidase II [Actinoallomurus rhizosphaericola]|uniref:signal peptidase II n=1 Tax=Actinoallomurus rhizosphaericola TaxID=2952536 RepID=UPI00273A6DAC|nr:signal peptidase II [Actinoallomurus rhizosphaericola]
MNPEEGAAAPPRRVSVLVAVAAAALAIDMISKVIVVALLQDHAPIKLLGGLLTLRVIRNSGAAFNIGNGMTYVFTVIATGVVVAILRYARRLRSLPWAITLGLLLGGALGNLADRMLRSPGPLRGHVVDWIELPHWPVFNLADSAIVCGGALAVILASRGLQVDGTVYRDGDDKDDAARTAASGAPPARTGGSGAGTAPGADAPSEQESTAPATPAAPAAPGDEAAPVTPPAPAAPGDEAASAAPGVPRDEAAPPAPAAPRDEAAPAEGGAPEGDGPAGKGSSVPDAKH